MERLGTTVLLAAMASASLGCGEAEPVAASEESFIRQLEPLTFDRACEEGEQLTIAAVGDVLIHGRLQRQALAHEEGFRSLWRETAEILASADVTYANLEGPTAPGVRVGGADVADPGKVFDDFVYTSYPQFNYHPSLIDDLKATGVDVVSTANNHSLDRDALGADRTIDELEARGMPFTGTRRRGESGGWATITEQKGFRLAWIACTYDTNGIPDRHDQVAWCWNDKPEILAEIESLQARDDVDAVIVTPHWGNEYEREHNDKQSGLAREMLDAGATVVIGAHPHVLQPWERYVTADGRETFVIYSLGNFVSGQRSVHRRSTMILNVGLTRTPSGEVIVNGVRYIPLNMARTTTEMTLELIDGNGGEQDSRHETVHMFGLHNLAPPVAPVVTNPECNPNWTPAQPEDGWIGGSCEASDVCGGNTCDTSWPAGHCSLPCDKYCPEAPGRASTFCVDTGAGGACVLKCTADDDCRDGYTCTEQNRFGETSVSAKVCVPSSPTTP